MRKSQIDVLADPPPGQIGLGPFLFVSAEIALAVLVIRQFQIESAAFLRIVLLAFAGFVVHAWLPLRWRLPCFAVLSVGAIGLVLGPREGAWLVGIGLVLIAVCHLPVSFGIRVTLLLALGALLVLGRADWLPAPWSQAVWPILGSMFMFRLIVYLYDLRHESVPFSLWRSLSYFFLLPNVCFPLFPVIDYKTFRRTHYDADAFRIYQRGVDWMARGITHLILYRVVYYYLTLAPSEVASPGRLTQFLVANFLLYLRVSGQFHIIVGLLHLFGFHLPETHHRYYLASSFTDFWRRINIYWKDFMLKIFYYPAYFKLRAWGPTPALVVSTLMVFALTWMLHAYQWFWLRGSFLLAWTDVTFWAVLAVLVVTNALWETKRGRTRTLGRARWTVRGSTGLALRTAGTFAVICALWSLWTSETFAAWLALWTRLADLRADSGLLGLAVIAAVVTGTTTAPSSGASVAGPRRWWRLSPLVSTSAITVVLLLGLALVSIQGVHTRFGPTVATFINSLRSGQLSRIDTALLERGYYEDLVRVDRFNSQLWEVYMQKPIDWLDVQGIGLERFTGDFRQKELVPSFAVLTRFGAISTNRWGMRDREYAQKPSAGTYRVTLLGASTVMGWGVGDGETFEALLENRLNHDGLRAGPARWEILNLAVPGYEPPQMLATLPKALGFQPNAMWYVAPGGELSAAARYLITAVQKGIEIPYAPLLEIVQRAGVEASTEKTTAERRLVPFRTQILSWIYQRIVAECREHGAVPVFVFLPQVYSGHWQGETPETLRLATEAGFVVLDLGDVYANQDINTVRLAEWDNHPNATAHRLIADRLYQELREHADTLFVRPVDAAIAAPTGSSRARRNLKEPIDARN
jgi:D-alanyl-lipoteichoic acid acyltransferase DltB (MBOAT superfamily)